MLLELFIYPSTFPMGRHGPLIIFDVHWLLDGGTPFLTAATATFQSIGLVAKRNTNNGRLRLGPWKISPTTPFLSKCLWKTPSLDVFDVHDVTFNGNARRRTR